MASDCLMDRFCALRRSLAARMFALVSRMRPLASGFTRYSEAILSAPRAQPAGAIPCRGPL